MNIEEQNICIGDCWNRCEACIVLFISIHEDVVVWNINITRCSIFDNLVGKASSRGHFWKITLEILLKDWRGIKHKKSNLIN